MCRWLAYSGAPNLTEEVLYGGTHSFVDQSLHPRLGAETTNGDGFGVGWYSAPAPLAQQCARAIRQLRSSCRCWRPTLALRSQSLRNQQSGQLGSRP